METSENKWADLKNTAVFVFQDFGDSIANSFDSVSSVSEFSSFLMTCVNFSSVEKALVTSCNTSDAVAWAFFIDSDRIGCFGITVSLSTLLMLEFAVFDGHFVHTGKFVG